jgi:hypothetical protein
LKLAAFTLPLLYDKIYLVVPKLGSKSSIKESAQKVLEPFTREMWFLVIGIILATALFSLWFMADSKSRNKNSTTTKEQSKRYKAKVCLRLVLDSFLEKGAVYVLALYPSSQCLLILMQCTFSGSAMPVLIRTQASLYHTKL